MWDASVKFLTLTEVWIGGLGLAAFLALFWVLRGAPPGQAVVAEDDEDAPRGGYRDRVIATVCLGLLLILLGAYLGVTRGVAWSMIPFMLGFATVLTLVLINQRYRHGSPTMRRTLDVSTAALNAALVAGVLIVVNVMVFRYGGRALDMTHEQAYSLSSRSLNQVRSLKRPVTFTTFFGRSAAAFLQYDRVRQLLELYQAANPDRVRLEHVDPFREQSRFEDLAKRAPAVDVTQGGGVVVEYGESATADRIVVRNADLFEVPRVPSFDPDLDRLETRFKGEDAITSALMRLREAKKPVIAFTTGHGEPSIDDTETTHPALGTLRTRLNSTGAEVISLNLLTQQIPDDAALVVVAGPKTPFHPDEESRLKAFADRKKPVLILIGDSEATGLNGLLGEFSVELGKGFVVEPRLNLRGRVEVVVVQVASPQHPIVEPLANQYLILPRAVPLKLAAPAPNSGTMTTVLLKSSVQSWAEPDVAASQAVKGPNKAAGPFNLALAVEDRRRPGGEEPAHRLVVLSSRFLVDNATVQTSPANLDLVVNAVSWLRGQSDSLGIDPKTHKALFLPPDPVLRARLILVPTVMAVLLIITLGVTTYLARRD
jgi:ABC-type uncharacterized transport system